MHFNFQFKAHIDVDTNEPLKTSDEIDKAFAGSDFNVKTYLFEILSNQSILRIHFDDQYDAINACHALEAYKV